VLASDINDICPFPTFASVFLISVFSVLIFSSFSSPWRLSTFLRALSGLLWPVWPRRIAVTVIYRTNRETKYATLYITSPFITKRVQAEIPSTGFTESEDAQSFKRNRQVCLFFKPWLHLTFRPCRPFYCDVFPLCLVWSGMTFMPSALCCDCYDRSEVVSLTEVVNNKHLCVNRCI